MTDQLIQLRRELHRYPDLSGTERATADRIRQFLRDHSPVRFIEDLGGESFAAVHAFPGPGPTVMIRCELDALPIAEANDFAHCSTEAGVSHKCGHDGHMAIVCGLLPWLTKQSFTGGRVVLLFQSAEETGQGARQVVESAGFRRIAPDYVFALHNIPGAPLHQVIILPGSFSAEVQSFALTLTGVACHAAEPGNGTNPAAAMADLISGLTALQLVDPDRPDYALLTPVYLLMGQKAYGLSPGTGELHYTIRTRTGQTMRAQVVSITELIQRTTAAHGLAYHLDWFEHFPATQNDPDANRLIFATAHAQELNVVERPHAFPFGEDFGWFSGHAKTAMFGLGAGAKTPVLHHPEYDFPDGLIGTGVAVFSGIIADLLPAEGE